MEKIKSFGNALYKFRYYIALIIFIICVLCEISGSSIGAWKKLLALENNEGVLYGESRLVRSDEWAVFTPMIFSQVFDGFKYFSDLIRGGNTDVFMIYGLPVLNPMQIFRPFQIGFLILGASKGLSFFWCGRFIALFMVMFELGMILTKKNRLLSLISAIMITLAPVIQWWFAVNGIVELFVFGGLAIILLKQYMVNSSFIKRCVCLLGLVICAGGYVLILYPSWQVPMAYVFLVLAIWVIVENRKECKLQLRDIFSIITAIVLFASCMIYIFTKSLDTLKIILNTVYPGARNETGGHMSYMFFDYIMNIFLPYKDIFLTINQCEKSVMFGLFPVGLIIAIVTMIREKKKDLLLILMLLVYLLLGLWCIVGFPSILAKLTLLSHAQAPRVMLAVGFLDVLILIRSLGIAEKPFNRIVSFILAIIISALLVLECKSNNVEYITRNMAIAMIVMCVYLFYFAFRYKAKFGKWLFASGIFFVMIMAGFNVNPIRIGTDIIYESSEIKEIQKINGEENGIWIAQGELIPAADFILMAGVPVINSVNTYPDLDKWKVIDKEGEYEEIYNRYAHINIRLINNENDIENKFTLLSPASFEVYLLPNELKDLNVKYIFTADDLKQYNTKEISFEKKADLDNGYYIYKMNY